MPITGVVLNSEDRTIPSDNTGDCYVTPKFNVSGEHRPYPGGYTLVLQQCIIPRSWYDINDSVNTIIIYDTSAPLVFVTLTIPPSDYSGASFAVWLQDTLNDGSGVFSTTTWEVTYGISSRKLTITSGGPNFDFLLTSNDFTAFEALGLPQSPTYYTPQESSTWTSPFPIRTNHSTFLYVVVDWPGIGTVVTATDENLSTGNRTTQTGPRAVICLADPPPAPGNTCDIRLFGEPYWNCNVWPKGNVRMQLFNHDWDPVQMNDDNWVVYFSVKDMPGTSNWLNHVTISEPDQDQRRPVLPNYDQNATMGNVFPPEGKVGLLTGRVHQRIPNPGAEGRPQKKIKINSRQAGRKNGTGGTI